MEITTREYALLLNTITDIIERLDTLRAGLSFCQEQVEGIEISAGKSNEKM